MPDTQSPPPRRLEHRSSARLFVGDAVIAFRLLNEARHRIMYRAFGMPREHSNLMTLFVIGHDDRVRGCEGDGRQHRRTSG